MKEFQVGLLKRAQGMVVHLTYGRGGSIVTAIVTDCPEAHGASAAYRMRRMVRAEWDRVEFYACTSTANLRLTALMAAGVVPLSVRGGLLLGVFLLGGTLSEERYSEVLTARRGRVDSGDLEIP